MIFNCLKSDSHKTRKGVEQIPIGDCIFPVGLRHLLRWRLEKRDLPRVNIKGGLLYFLAVYGVKYAF